MSSGVRLDLVLKGLSRRFRSADDNGSKTLDLAEFTKCMHEMNISSLGLKDMRTLFEYFDKDGNGVIDFEEFLQALRGISA